MKQKELQPIRETPELFDRLEAVISAFFKKEIYIPLLKEVKAKQTALTNSYEDLISAIASGQIQYVNGGFKGQFNATLSRELRRLGAKWDRKQGSWKVPHSKLNADMRMAMVSAESKFKEMASRVDKKLSSLLPEDLAQKLKLENIFESVLYQVDRSVTKTLKDVTIPLELTEEQAKRVSVEYTQNMQLYIQDFMEKEIVELRKNIQARAAQGIRYESMVEEISKSYGVSQRKAKFLARQETSLLMTKFKQLRYQDAGVNEYKWRCVAGSPKHPVRPMHKKLDGTIHSWDNPPIVDEQGNRKNPGQDYNCRCVAIPIAKF